MSSTNDAVDPSLSFQAILNAALAKYLEHTGRDLLNDPLATEIQRCESPDDILSVFKKQAEKFDEFNKVDSKLMKCIDPIVNGLFSLSTNAILKAGVSLAFPPSQVVFSGISILLSTAKEIKKCYDTLVELFECIEHFLRRLGIYAKIPSTHAVTGVLIQIMVEVLSVLALSTRQMKEGRFRKFAKRLLGDDDVQGVLSRLDRLTKEESLATGAHTLEVVHCLINSMTVVMEDGKASTSDFRKGLVHIQQLVEGINKANRLYSSSTPLTSSSFDIESELLYTGDQLQEKFLRWLSPPDPSTNHNTARKFHRNGTALWFTKGDTFRKWKATGSLLWIHGNPGSGKSILCSTVIQDIQDLRKAGLATVGYFYFDFGDSSKQSARGFLSSLLIQLCAQSDSYCDVLSDVHSEHNCGSAQPSDDVLLQSLKSMLKLSGQAPFYIIVDGLDECPNPSQLTSRRGEVLEVIEELINLHHPHLHLCVTSRPEADIKVVLKPLSTHHISLHDEPGQARDIATHIKSVIHSHRKMRGWPDDIKKLVTNSLSRNGGGMFRWASLQLDRLCQCPLQDIESVLKELPKTLDGTYERMLRSINEEYQKYAHRIFQCLTVSVRPLHVEELAEVFAIRVGAEANTLPEFNARWRPQNAEDAVLSACSTLVSVVNAYGSKVVQFSHFSVKEYLASPRLEHINDISYYHIRLQPAHTFLAQACLCILLQLDVRIDKNRIKDFPLAPYAAQQWVNHARFKNVLPNIRDGMDFLFDKDKPHFAAWVWLCDFDISWRSYMPSGSSHPGQPRALPLYYATLCGFSDMVERLVNIDPQDVNARGGNHGSPLHAAVETGHLEIAQFLLQQGADVNIHNNEGATLLHLASRDGDIKVMRLLLDHGADPNVKDASQDTPLILASKNRKSEAARMILKHGANVDARNDTNTTPLHLSSQYGDIEIMTLLLDHHADPNVKDGGQHAPLLLALMNRKLDAIRLLLEHGADVNSRNYAGTTPLHLSSQVGDIEVMRMLLDNGADPNMKDQCQLTPLILASTNRKLEAARMLLEHGADLNARNNKGMALLPLALRDGDMEVIRFLIDHGADPNMKDGSQVTPLMLAWTNRKLASEASRILLEHGANANARNTEGATLLHLASQDGDIEIIRSLLRHGADPNMKDEGQDTPLIWVSRNRKLEPEAARMLLDHGADANARDKKGVTPLHFASWDGDIEVMKFLLSHGADPNVKDESNVTPLILTSRNGKLEATRMLLEHGADMNYQIQSHWTWEGQSPLAKASFMGHSDVVQLLLDHGAKADEQDMSNSTPLHYALLSSHANVARVLLDRGANVNAQAIGLYTPLHIAAANGYLEIVDYLLECGADPNIRNKNGKTPSQVASERGHHELAHLLSGHASEGT